MFIVIPTAGSPRIVRQHPSPAAVSDALGGAIPTLLGNALSTCVFAVRETFVTEGLDRNPVAEVVMSMNMRHTIPVGGPVVVCGLHVSPESDLAEDGVAMAEPICIPEARAEGIRILLEDIRAALEGRQRDLSDDVTASQDEWCSTVCRLADHCSSTPYPPGWPNPLKADPVASAFRKMGIVVQPQPPDLQADR